MVVKFSCVSKFVINSISEGIALMLRISILSLKAEIVVLPLYVILNSWRNPRLQLIFDTNNFIF